MEKRGKPDRCQPWAMCDTMGPRCFQNEKVDAMAQNGQDEQVSSLVRIQQIMAPEQRPGVSDWMLFMTCWAVIAGVVAVLVRRDINESLTVAAGIVLLLGMFSSAGVFFAIGSKMWWPRAITAVSLLASGLTILIYRLYFFAPRTWGWEIGVRLIIGFYFVLGILPASVLGVGHQWLTQWLLDYNGARLKWLLPTLTYLIVFAVFLAMNLALAKLFGATFLWTGGNS